MISPPFLAENAAGPGLLCVCVCSYGQVTGRAERCFRCRGLRLQFFP